MDAVPSLRSATLDHRGVVTTGGIGGGALTDRARVLAKPPCLAPMFGGIGPGQDYTAGKQSRWPTRPFAAVIAQSRGLVCPLQQPFGYPLPLSVGHLYHYLSEGTGRARPHLRATTILSKFQG